MEAGSSATPSHCSVQCLLKYWKDLGPQTLKNALIFTVLRLGYSILWGTNYRGSLAGSPSYITILQLDLFYKGKWSEVPYVQLFFTLWDYSKWVSQCSLNPVS